MYFYINNINSVKPVLYVVLNQKYFNYHLYKKLEKTEHFIDYCWGFNALNYKSNYIFSNIKSTTAQL